MTSDGMRSSGAGLPQPRSRVAALLAQLDQQPARDVADVHPARQLLAQDQREQIAVALTSGVAVIFHSARGLTGWRCACCMNVAVALWLSLGSLLLPTARAVTAPVQLVVAGGIVAFSLSARAHEPLDRPPG